MREKYSERENIHNLKNTIREEKTTEKNIFEVETICLKSFEEDILGKGKHFEWENTTREGGNIDGDSLYEIVLAKKMTLNGKTMLDENKK